MKQEWSRGEKRGTVFVFTYTLMRGRVALVEGSKKGIDVDTSTAQYMAAISLSNLTMYELTPLTWHVSSHGDNSLEGQVPHGEDASQIVNEWAEFLECDVTMTEYEDWTSLRLETNFGDYGTFIKIWGHTQTNSR